LISKQLQGWLANVQSEDKNRKVLDVKPDIHATTTMVTSDYFIYLSNYRFNEVW